MNSSLPFQTDTRHPPAAGARPALPADPAAIYGDLFTAVQRSGVFSDQKTFVDCVPKTEPAQIVEQYHHARLAPGFNLGAFIHEHFLVPQAVSVVATIAESVEHHLAHSWDLLRREPDMPVIGSSLLPLSHPYVIPGGRFREVYYWDSYFTLLGLREHAREDLVRSITDNLADLLHRYGLIPNGNRTYYLTRSQPPVLSLMVEFVMHHDGPSALERYLPALQAELDYWNDVTASTQHVVALPGGGTLQRYYDQSDCPRWEAFSQDEHLSRVSPQAPGELYRNLRSGGESGWDFSSRWFMGGETLGHIRTTEFVPVDLNCFLLHLERTLSKALAAAGRTADAERMAEAATRREQLIQRHCWSDAHGFFFDHHLPTGQCSPHYTMAAVVPLFIRCATQAQADAVAAILRERFLQAGGLQTTLTRSGEQWDAPNGWAPLQWMAVTGLVNYGHNDLAAEIAQRWINLNVGVFARTGRLMEKYNVVDLSLPAGGGEYPTQDGFAWTNAVLLKLLKSYPLVKAEAEPPGPGLSCRCETGVVVRPEQ
ncbi:MAG TPA: alpha,alpha-trehalase TreF [Lacunisphaera sp.]|nr:alpha,alpha-trehalase TreF [Lacunisphaera sp.]